EHHRRWLVSWRALALVALAACPLSCTQRSRTDVAAAGAPAAARPPAQPSAGDLRRSGTVRLAITCAPAVRAPFQDALALLHSFFYDEARRRFTAIAERDPDCAMAWWGVAMTWYHPLWAPPTQEEMTAGAAAAREARARLAGASDLERGLVEAIDAYYRTGAEIADPAAPVEPSCHGPRAPTARAEAFRRGMERLRARHPGELEVKVFTALALLATAPPGDRSFRNQLAAATILEPLLSRHPDHPGVAHYLIHAYDYPELAERGLAAARRYDDVAPWVPHALHMPSHIYTRLGMWQESIEAKRRAAAASRHHARRPVGGATRIVESHALQMPSHIYTRLGMWQESIESNRRAAAASRDHARRAFGGATWFEELHALDYLAFAHLQRGEHRAVRRILRRLRSLDRLAEPNVTAAYALGAIPARFALERRRWRDAAALEFVQPEVIHRFPFAAAHVWFARALGAARSGDVPRARWAVRALEQVQSALDDPELRWWSDQVGIQRLAASGWLAHAEGRQVDALRLLGEAAALEERAGTHPVTPGQILPAREQRGDLLMLLDRPA